MTEELIAKKYKEILKKKNKFGDYKKILFHVHTPASYDYRFKKGWKPEDYINLPEEKLYSEYIKGNLDEQLSIELRDIQLSGKLSDFESPKDFYSYLLIADSLLKRNYEMVVVTDHNALKGNRKLQIALDYLYEKPFKHCNVIYGVEITCADRLHVVCVFKREKLNEIEKWLDEHLISEEYGVMKSSYDVIKDFYDFNCYAYIAHINTSDLFNGKNIYSGGYKKELLSSEYSNFIGVNSESAISLYDTYLQSIKKKERNYILDCDAHGYDEIPDESMWIKVTNNTTTALYEALEEYKITVRLRETKVPDIFIEGILIDYNKEGFLTGKNSDNYCVKYSPSLNSYIGGRGTGKSTTLDLIDFALTQDFKDEKQLYFFSSHGDISILVNYYNEKYVINVTLPSMHSPIDLIALLSDLDPERYRESIQYSKQKIKRKILQKYLTVYKIDFTNQNDIKVEEQSSKKPLLKKIYDEKYSINTLVEMANNGRIGEFIYGLLFDTRPLEALSKQVRFRSEKGLLKFFGNLNDIQLNRKNEIEDIINPYNNIEKDKMRIVYSQKSIDDYELPSVFKLSKSIISREYDITQSETEDYIRYLIRHYSVTGFVKLCLEKNGFNNLPSISTFAINGREPNYDKKKLSQSDSAYAVKLLLEEFLKENDIQVFANYYKRKLEKLEQFTVEFNVNTYESSRDLKNIFKDISELSLGQKVVTILNLILSYGVYSENLKPIIIDQPEDNLDSRYIYKNLVEQLRELKEKRQIIIATHNSTIVTNSLSENVLTMESDGVNGWVSKYGYVLDHSIKKEILNILEGGKDSFAHRQQVFTNILH